MTEVRPRLMTSLCLALIRLYQYALSPLFPPSCRFRPTCSEYAAEAIGRFGPVRGGLLALWRIVRCNPWSRGGLDPVPGLPPLRGPFKVAWPAVDHEPKRSVGGESDGQL